MSTLGFPSSLSSASWQAFAPTACESTPCEIPTPAFMDIMISLKHCVMEWRSHATSILPNRPSQKCTSRSLVNNEFSVIHLLPPLTLAGAPLWQGSKGIQRFPGASRVTGKSQTLRQRESDSYPLVTPTLLRCSSSLECRNLPISVFPCLSPALFLSHSSHEAYRAPRFHLVAAPPTRSRVSLPPRSSAFFSPRSALQASYFSGPPCRCR